ncbi:hypothetical protein, partial [Fulvivirga sp.]|uniref:hypothetical protein n=1 Tax=Fulvivirga sp. TaxID=1931237 RepID=UPI0032EBE504
MNQHIRNRLSILKILKKSLIIATIIIVTIMSIGSIYIYLNQDKIIQQFVSEANKHLNTKVEVGNISVSFIETFPKLTIQFDDINIKGSIKTEQDLLQADNLSVTLDPFQIIEGNYVVEGVWIKNATCSIIINKDGEVNYNILKKAENGSASFKVELSYVQLVDVNFSYLNEESLNEIVLKTNETKASLITENSLYNINALGNFQIDYIKVNNNIYLKEKLVQANSKLVYDDAKKSLEISPSDLIIENSEFQTYGNYQFKEDRNIKLFIEAKETDIQAITNLLPDNIASKLARYNSDGSAYFDLSLSGSLDSKYGPELVIHFGLNDSRIDYAEKNVSVTNTSLEGFYSQSKLYDNTTALLELKNVVGNLEGQKFESNLTLKNFEDLHLSLDFDGSMTTSALFDFLKVKGLSSSEGELDVVIQFDGRINDLKSKELTNKVKTSGQLELKNITLDSGLFKLPVYGLSGLLFVNQKDIAINDLSGSYGNSDFNLNGYFRNILAYLLLPNEPLGIEASFESKNLNLNELLSTKDKTSGNYTFKLSPKLRLSLNCTIDRMNFRRFRANDLKGSVQIKNQRLSSESIVLN